jgi:hypothetical protein
MARRDAGPFFIEWRTHDQFSACHAPSGTAAQPPHPTKIAVAIDHESHRK